MLELKNIAIGYETTFFKTGDICLETGKFYTLIGKNGAGKSTFFRTLCKQTFLKSGSISLDGTKLENIKSTSKLIAMVDSRFDGVQHLKVVDYLALGRVPYTDFLGRVKADDLKIIDEALELLGIQYLKEKDTTFLSDGERQLASIARALVQETPLILLDEPTAFLDYKNKILVLETLKKIAQEKQKLIIQSSHDLDLSLQYSDAFLLINQGTKLMEQYDSTSKEHVVELAF